MEAMAQHRGSMDDSFHLPNFPHMAWVNPSALPTIVIMPSLRARDECIIASFITLFSPSRSPIHIVSQEDDALLVWMECACRWHSTTCWTKLMVFKYTIGSVLCPTPGHLARKKRKPNHLLDMPISPKTWCEYLQTKQTCFYSMIDHLR